MIMLDTGTPDNCAGSPYGWMLIKEKNITMVNTVLHMWLNGKKNVTIYTSGRTGNGYCVINQVDPDN